MDNLKADMIGREIQKKVHDSMGRRLPANSFEPENETRRKTWAGKYIKVNDLRYADKYPNSFLDLYLPDKGENKIPILLYAHGGGFLFCGKASGDAYANSEQVGANEKNGFSGFIEQILEMGIAVASMEYAMAPEYRFPVQIEQMDQAIDFLVRNAEVYNLDMSRLFLMGSSAGADMVELYAAAVGNREYGRMIGLSHQAVSIEDISGVIIDESALTKDAPGETNAVILDQVWFGTDHLEECQNKKISFAPEHIKEYPSSFINCSTEEAWFYDSTYPLYQVLKEKEAETEFFMPEDGKYRHGYMMDYASDQVAEECLTKVKMFIRRNLENSKW